MQKLCTAGLACIALAGCAIAPEYEPLTITSRYGTGVCTLTNDRGSWSVRVPGTVHVLRSGQPVAIECRSDSGTVTTTQLAPVREHTFGYVPYDNYTFSGNLALRPVAKAGAP